MPVFEEIVDTRGSNGLSPAAMITMRGDPRTSIQRSHESTFSLDGRGSESFHPGCRLCDVRKRISVDALAGMQYDEAHAFLVIRL